MDIVPSAEEGARKDAETGGQKQFLPLLREIKKRTEALRIQDPNYDDREAVQEATVAIDLWREGSLDDAEALQRVRNVLGRLSDQNPGDTLHARLPRERNSERPVSSLVGEIIKRIEGLSSEEKNIGDTAREEVGRALGELRENPLVERDIVARLEEIRSRFPSAAEPAKVVEPVKVAEFGEKEQEMTAENFIMLEDIETGFKKLGFSKEELVNVEVPGRMGQKIGFVDLTPSRQRALLESLEQFARENAKKEAEEHYESDKELKLEGLGSGMKLAKSLWMRVTRGSSLRQREETFLGTPDVFHEKYASFLRKSMGIGTRRTQGVRKH